MDPDLENSIDAVAKAVLSAGKLTCFTGAGISVESGIPDFRSPGGLWSRYNPFEYCDYDTFKSRPHLFWQMARELVLDVHITLGGTIEEALAGDLKWAEPNGAHKALKDLEDMGLLTKVMTQNIDGLHTKAGNTEIIEVHGTDTTSSCMNCAHKVDQKAVVAQWVASFQGKPRVGSVDELRRTIQTDKFVPKCPECQGVLKADVTFFGEALPTGAMFNSVKAVLGAGVCLVVGSSLEVAPANFIPSSVKLRFGTLVVNNADESGKASAHYHLQGNSSVVLPALVEKIRELQEKESSKKKKKSSSSSENN